MMTDELCFDILDDLSTELALREFYTFIMINHLSWELVEDPSREKEFQHQIVTSWLQDSLEYDIGSAINMCEGLVIVELYDEDHYNGDSFSCANCGTRFFPGCHSFKNHRDIFVCDECVGGFLNSFEETKESVACDNCRRVSDGGYRHGELELCESCMSMPDLLKRYDEDMMYLVSDVNWFKDVLIDVSPVSVENLEIIPGIAPMRDNMILSWHLPLLKSCDAGNSLLNWMIIACPRNFSNMTHREDYFAINCEKGSKHEIASVTSLPDESGWLCFDILYPSYDEYERAFENWKMTKLPDNEIKERISDLLERGFFEDDMSPDELATVSLTFAEYVRHKYNLNYGLID